MNKFCSADAKRRFLFRDAALFVILLGAAACASLGGPQWAAHGYLTPGPTSEPEIIGVYDNERECRAAVDAWMGRQVVGNPIFSECLPVERD